MDHFAAIVAKLRAAGCVFAEDEARLLAAEATTPADLDAMAAERVTGVPLEHIVGWAELCGVRVAVDHDVFVPRPRTELLVRRAAALARAVQHAVIVDVCCGSGAIGAVITTLVGHPIELHATDLDPAAVRCARRNLEHLPTARVYRGDLFDPLPARLKGHVDLITANVPYVPTGDIRLMPAEARDHEPALALDGGTDGLDLARRVATEAPHWLSAGGHLLVETSRTQAPQAADFFAAVGLTPRVISSASLEATIVVGLNQERGRQAL